jgi:DNA-directed RNA polymerase specialized sigma24 family protein
MFGTVSPLTLRRYRAERLLRQEFAGLRGKVLTVVRGRLSSRGVRLDAADLDSAYAQAWHGLYAAVLDGEEIASPGAWLTVVTFRRALDEHRSRVRDGDTEDLEEVRSGPHEAHHGRDLAAQLDDRLQLRQLFEGLRTRLSPRECQAASLCYLQGLPRAEAASHMGISDARMRKLMEGQGAGRPGVAGKVGQLLDTIRGGDWCEQQSSLMRGLAFGILDPDGERYQLAQLHLRECPACRAYVVSLRGLAAVLPPVFLPWGLGVSALTGAGAGAGIGASGGAAVGSGAGAGSGIGVGGGAGVGSGAGAGGAAGGAAVGSGAAVGAGSTVGAVAAVGGAAGGSGWLFAGGSVGVKLAMGCLIALGVGAGCGALIDGSHRHGPTGSRHQSAHVASAGASAAVGSHGLNESIPGALGQRATSGSAHLAALGAKRSTRSGVQAHAASATREFGIEGSHSAHSASAGSGSQPASGRRVLASQAELTGRSRAASTSSQAPSTRSSSTSRGAAREFGVG